MSKAVLDASALLALFNSESGSSIVLELLPMSLMSTVNVAEVIAELDKKFDVGSRQSSEMIAAAIAQIIPLDFDFAVKVGELKKLTQVKGLSLGDRACIALGMKMNCPIYTADKAWSGLNIEGINIIQIR